MTETASTNVHPAHERKRGRELRVERKRNRGIADLAHAILEAEGRGPRGAAKVRRIYWRLLSRKWYDPARPLEAEVVALVASMRSVQALIAEKRAASTADPKSPEAPREVSATVDRRAEEVLESIIAGEQPVPVPPATDNGRTWTKVN